MVTTTTSPCCDELACRRRSAIEPAPLTNAPPWIQNMTGRFASSSAGVVTLRVRHCASSHVGGAAPSIFSSGDGSCGANGLACVASSTPSHGTGGAGGRKRSLPTGGAANGMPRNTLTSVADLAADLARRSSTRSASSITVLMLRAPVCAAIAAPTMPAWFSSCAGTISARVFSSGRNFALFLLDAAAEDEEVRAQQRLDVGEDLVEVLGPLLPAELLLLADLLGRPELRRLAPDVEVAELGVRDEHAVDEQRAADAGAERDHHDGAADCPCPAPCSISAMPAASASLITTNGPVRRLLEERLRRRCRSRTCRRSPRSARRRAA